LICAKRAWWLLAEGKEAMMEVGGTREGNSSDEELKGMRKQKYVSKLHVCMLCKIL
jgi:hypothetical protein